jgi:hypothetical protein
VDTQLDVKVQAYIGHESVITVIDWLEGHGVPCMIGSHEEDGIMFDTAGNWSHIQTVTINSNNIKNFGEPEAPDTPKTTDDKLTSESTADSQKQGTLDLTWVPKEEPFEVEQFAAIFGVAAIIAALAVGLVVYAKKHA